MAPLVTQLVLAVVISRLDCSHIIPHWWHCSKLGMLSAHLVLSHISQAISALLWNCCVMLHIVCFSQCPLYLS